MRARMEPEDKRSKVIGIKVKQTIKEQIEFISAREARPVSTQINMILESYIQQYFNENKIKWEEYAPKKGE